MMEFDLHGKQYRAEKLNAFQQFHVSRKIAPLIPALLPIFLEIARNGSEAMLDEKHLDKFAPMLQNFADGLATLPDSAAEYVMSTCLAVVRRRHADNWVPIWSSSANAVMFDDINDMGTLLPIVVRVIQGSLGPFISGLLTSQRETEAPAASPGAASQTEKTGSSTR